MKLNYKINFAIVAMLIALIIGCGKSYSPKPKGYARIDFDEKKYTTSDSTYPYLFDIPTYCKMEDDKNSDAEPYWVNVQFPKLNATLHISYKKINNNLNKYTEDSRKMVYKHASKADNIIPKEWVNNEEKVFGMLYDIKGDAASTLQFFLTDSINHFLRASFYFNTIPNKDSLAPAQAFIRKDIDRMIESFKWNKDFK